MEMKGRKSVAALAALALMTATTAFADRGGERGGISNKTLNGAYIMEGGGFDLNDVAVPPGHTGEVAFLGVANFDGKGGFTGTFTFTSADSGGDQVSCVETLKSGDGTYSITSTGAPGTGNLTLGFDSSSTDSAGSMSFALVVPSADGKGARILQNDGAAFIGLKICNQPIAALSLKGTLRKAIPNNN